MSNKDVAIVVLAAGKGTRLKSSLAKVLHQAGGRPLIEHVVRACLPLGAKKIVVVIGHQGDKVAEKVQPLGAQVVVQQPQNGTGDAPLVQTSTLKNLLAKHKNGGAAATILTAVLADPSGYGRILRKSGDTVAAIVEESQLSPEQQEINEINSSIYCFTAAKFWPALAKVKPNNKHREIYLTDAFAILSGAGEAVLAEVAADARETLGCNTRMDLADVDRTFRSWKRQQLMESGVTIQLPETVVIDSDVVAGEDTVIEPCVQLLGKTKIGARCVIKTGSVLHDMLLGDDVVVEPHCVMTSSRLDDDVVAGPFARLRPESHLKRGARIGNFVELKKSTLGEGTKAPHLSYIGDSRVGTKSNIGAGTITCNYDGFAKYPTTIGNRVFVGSNATLVAPVKIGDGGYVAAASVITENVPSDALAIGRGRQVNKPGWASKKRREMGSGHNAKKSKKHR